MKVIEAVNRWNNGLPPPRPKPGPERIRSAVPTPASPSRGGRPIHKSRHVGVRLTQRDYVLLLELARAHAVRAGTMARMLIVRGVRAAADG
ncbi:MAG: hypothetical protein ACJ75Z_05650 [Solirubrobacterales bacterium]